MKNFRLSAGLLGVLGLALLGGCATPSSRTARAAPPATYAVIAVDSHGVLSAAEFKKVEVGVIQYLLDEGYVRAEDKYVTDVLNAEIVFRVRIAWQGTKGGFTVTQVEPTFSPRPYAESGGGVSTATGYVPWYAPGGWYDNPWWYGDYYGYNFWPYAGIAGLSAFAPAYFGGGFGRRAPDRDLGRRGDRDPRGRPDLDRRGHVRQPDYYAHSGSHGWNAGHPHPGGAIRNGDHRDGSHSRLGGAVHEHHWWSARPASVRTGGSHDGAYWRERNRAFAAHRTDRSFQPVRASTPGRGYARSYSPPARSYSRPARSYAAPARSYSRPAEHGSGHDANSRRQEK